MYTVVNHLKFTKPVDELKEITEKEGAPLLAGHKGFKSFQFVKVDERNAIVIINWEDAASAMEGAKSFGPTWFATHYKPYLEGPENRYIGEVIVHRV